MSSVRHIFFVVLEGGRQVQYRVVEVASSSFWGLDKSPPITSGPKCTYARINTFPWYSLHIIVVFICLLIMSTSVQADDEFAEKYKTYQQHIKPASSAFQKKDYPTAITNYNKAIEMSPFEINIYHNRGIALFPSSGSSNRMVAR